MAIRVESEHLDPDRICETLRPEDRAALATHMLASATAICALSNSALAVLSVPESALPHDSERGWYIVGFGAVDAYRRVEQDAYDWHSAHEVEWPLPDAVSVADVRDLCLPIYASETRGAGGARRTFGVVTTLPRSEAAIRVAELLDTADREYGLGETIDALRAALSSVTAYLIEIEPWEGAPFRRVFSERSPTMRPEWADYRVIATSVGVTFDDAARGLR